jgi:hypothetical protein
VGKHISDVTSVENHMVGHKCPPQGWVKGLERAQRFHALCILSRIKFRACFSLQDGDGIMWLSLLVTICKAPSSNRHQIT